MLCVCVVCVLCVCCVRVFCVCCVGCVYVEEEDIMPWDKEKMERPDVRGLAGVGAEGELA